jgi:hypothetical protein
MAKGSWRSKTRFSDIVILLAIAVIILLSFYPVYEMAAKKFGWGSQTASTNVSAHQQLESIYVLSGTNKTIESALLILEKEYEISTEGKISLLTKSDGKMNTIIKMTKDSPSSGQTTTEITVSMIESSSKIQPCHIKTIFFFK